ncbi:MAG TPA: SprB repeat-containing protein [Saprospiraceae bacterium]|nr:SprB repeat-containing protein [Saprospiraceae bacterium]
MKSIPFWRFLIIPILVSTVLSLGYLNQLSQGYTGAPGEGLCQPCHHEPLNGITGGIKVQGLPANVIAGHPYSITVSVYKGSNVGKNTGFQFTLITPNGLSQGQLTENDAHVAIHQFGNRQYAQHEPGIPLNQNGVGDTAKYHFQWTPDLVNMITSAQCYYSGLLGDAANSIRGDTGFAGIRQVSIVPVLEGQIEVLSEPLCYESHEGSMKVIPTGGKSPFSYHWSIGSSTAQINNLPAGNYSVTVTDAIGQLVTLSQSLQSPDPLNMDVQITDPLCAGQPGGMISIFVAGGTPGYTYFINGEQTGSVTNGLFAGDYNISVHDAHDCTIELMVPIAQPDSLHIQLIEVDPQTPTMGGSVEIQPTGGVTPYDYFWEGPGNYTAVSQNIFDLTAGTYTLTLTDANQCETQYAVIVEFSSALGDEINRTGIQLFPNPGHEVLQLTASAEILDSWSTWFYSIEGIPVWQEQWHGSLNRLIHVPSEVKPGAYLIHWQGKTSGIQDSRLWIKSN